jgi:hypothetical protein
MSIFLGDRPVSVFFNGAAAGLPVQGVFLGGIQVFPTGAAATLYYNNAEEDGLWTTVGNWWLDAEHTIAAGRLPAASDNVVLNGFIEEEDISVEVANLTFFSPPNAFFFIFGLTITVTGSAIVAGDQTLFQATIIGNATFNDSSFNDGTVNGNATFNDNSANFGTVTGNATFNDNSTNDGTVNGTITDNT